jgi:hypothetical protein
MMLGERYTEQLQDVYGRIVKYMVGGTAKLPYLLLFESDNEFEKIVQMSRICY